VSAVDLDRQPPGLSEVGVAHVVLGAVLVGQRKSRPPVAGWAGAGGTNRLTGSDRPRAGLLWLAAAAVLWRVAA